MVGFRKGSGRRWSFGMNNCSVLKGTVGRDGGNTVQKHLLRMFPQNQILTRVFLCPIISLWSPMCVRGKVTLLTRQTWPLSSSDSPCHYMGSSWCQTQNVRLSRLRGQTQKYSVVNVKVITVSNSSHWHRIKPLLPPCNVKDESARAAGCPILLPAAAVW